MNLYMVFVTSNISFLTPAFPLTILLHISLPFLFEMIILPAVIVSKTQISSTFINLAQPTSNIECDIYHIS